jgi:hypothetical protein
VLQVVKFQELIAWHFTQCLRASKILKNIITNIDPQGIGFGLTYIHVGFIDNAAFRMFFFIHYHEIYFYIIFITNTVIL